MIIPTIQTKTQNVIHVNKLTKLYRTSIVKRFFFIIIILEVLIANYWPYITIKRNNTLVPNKFNDMENLTAIGNQSSNSNK